MWMCVEAKLGKKASHDIVDIRGEDTSLLSASPPPRNGGGGYQYGEYGSKVHMHTVVYAGHMPAYVHCV